MLRRTDGKLDTRRLGTIDRGLNRRTLTNLIYRVVGQPPAPGATPEERLRWVRRAGDVWEALLAVGVGDICRARSIVSSLVRERPQIRSVLESDPDLADLLPDR